MLLRCPAVALWICRKELGLTSIAYQKQLKITFKKKIQSRVWYPRPVIPTAAEAEAGGSQVEGQPDTEPEVTLLHRGHGLTAA